ncbi:MAG: acyl-CoA dehydratase activase-related protein [Raoultibacter sp.]
MKPADLFPQTDCADIKTIGIPRALLYYRYRVLWTTFFEQIGREVVVSGATDRDILFAGESASVDECCLASKLYLGHLESLIGSCDAVFIPSIVGVGRREAFCTKFQALPDLVANTFYERNIRIVSMLIDTIEARTDEKTAFVGLGQRFGVSAADAKRAYHVATKAQQRSEMSAARAQERVLQGLKEQLNHGVSDVEQGNDALTILVVAHPYVAHDPFIGGGVSDALESLGATVLFADETEHARTLKASFGFSETLPWVINRELVGSVLLLHEQVDGIVLMSAFPCGPDSMTNDAIARCVQGKPILTLTVDAQSGTAGLETRIESFIDILRYQQGGGYLHGR